MEYTKGKWTVHELHRTSNSFPPPLAELIPSPVITKIQIVALNAFNKISATEGDYEESRANAQLIAAAPDMYEACKLVLKDLDVDGGVVETIRTLERAIAKAEGRPT